MSPNVDPRPANRRDAGTQSPAATVWLLGRALHLAWGAPDLSIDARKRLDTRIALRVDGVPVDIETDAQLLALLTQPSAPWSAIVESSGPEAALLLEHLCTRELRDVESALCAPVAIETLRVGAPPSAPGGGLSLSVALDEGVYPARLFVADSAMRERLGARVAAFIAGGNASAPSVQARAVVALGPIDDAGEAMAAAEVGDLVLIAGAEEMLKAVVWTPTLVAPARLGVDTVALEAAFAPRSGTPDVRGFIEIGEVAVDPALAPGAERAFAPFDGDRARYTIAGRVLAHGRLVNSGGDLAFAIDALEPA